VTRLLALRRLFAILAVVASLVFGYLTYSGSSFLPFAQSAGFALFAATFLVMAFEERARSKETFPIVFPLLAGAMFMLSLWVFTMGLAKFG
jgi:asparagine N-glycosylation enzyme membrane subunit Stt3